MEALTKGVVLRPGGNPSCWLVLAGFAPNTIILFPLTGEYILHNTISPSFKCARYCRPGLLLIHLSIPGGHLYNCCKSEYAQFILKTRLCVDVLFYHIPFLKSLILHTTPRTEQRWVGLRIMNPPLSQILIHTKILVGYGNPTPKYQRQIFPGLLFRKSAPQSGGFCDRGSFWLFKDKMVKMV